MRGRTFAVILAVVGAAVLASVAMKMKSSNEQILGQVPGPIVDAFAKWTATHNKMYVSPSEKSYRMNVFTRNFYNVVNLNKKHSHNSALNKFADLTEEEFVAKYTGLKIPKTKKRSVVKHVTSANRPASIDWTKLGAVNAVKDQGQCGSCWAFSATSAIESAWKLSGKPLINLAEQQLVDCAGDTGNYGCNGGWMDWAFQSIINNGGQELTSAYPYTAQDGNCAFNKAKVAATISKFGDVPANNCDNLLDSIAQQPVSVAIAANAIMFYNNGVFSVTTCGTQINHGVTAVGYGTDSTVNKDFYLVRNSWGPTWGEQGYIRFDRSVQTSTGICAICSVASYPIV